MSDSAGCFQINLSVILLDFFYSEQILQKVLLIVNFLNDFFTISRGVG